MKSQQDLKTDRSFRNHNIQPLYCVTTSCSLSVQFLGCSTIPLEARASKRYGPSSWKLLQPLLRTMRCFSQSLQMQEERFYMDISSGGGPQGNCQQVDAWICKIAWIFFFKGMCVSDSPISTGGASKKQHDSHHFHVHFLQLRPPFDIPRLPQPFFCGA